MTEEELQVIEERCAKATAGPWVDLKEAYFNRMNAYKKATGRWWHGTKEQSLPDSWEFEKVLSLHWSAFPKRTSAISEGFLLPEDSAFITHARSDVPALLAEVRRLRAMVERQAPAHHRQPGASGTPPRSQSPR